MTVREYIGARYVPLYMGEWDNTNTYEPLSVVSYQGNSYTSRQAVPVGIPITNEIYWVVSGNYNAQVEAYRQEVRTFDSRITSNQSAIAQERSERREDFADLDGRLNTEINTRLSEDNTIKADNWVTTNRINNSAVTTDKIANDAVTPDKIANGAVTTDKINDSAITYDKLSDEVKLMSKSYDTYVVNTYVDNVNGNDDTAEIDNINRPFKTLNAAMLKSDIVTGNFRIYFLCGGNYYWTAKVVYGSVIHFFANTTRSGTGPVTIHINNDLKPDDPNYNFKFNNLFLYDSHINFTGTAENKLNINIEWSNSDGGTAGQIEAEGSTIWAANTIFNVKRIYCIQGSSYFNACTLNCSYQGIFSDVRFRETYVNNNLAEPAVLVNCGIVRCEAVNDASLVISNNASYTSGAAIELYSAEMNLNAGTKTLNGIRSNYAKFIDARGSTVRGSRSLFNLINTYAQNNSEFTSYCIVVDSDWHKLQGLTAATSIPAESTTDITVTFPYELPSAPNVFLTPRYNGSNVNFGNVVFSYLDQTTTGFKIRIFNPTQSTFNTYVAWLAIL